MRGSIDALNIYVERHNCIYSFICVYKSIKTSFVLNHPPCEYLASISNNISIWAVNSQNEWFGVSFVIKRLNVRAHLQIACVTFCNHFPYIIARAINTRKISLHLNLRGRSILFTCCITQARFLTNIDPL